MLKQEAVDAIASAAQCSVYNQNAMYEQLDKTYPQFEFFVDRTGAAYVENVNYSYFSDKIRSMSEEEKWKVIVEQLSSVNLSDFEGEALIHDEHENTVVLHAD